MLTMENKNMKFRNPLPAVGKVFKYEMISTARMIVPVVAVLFVLSLIIGLFVMDNNLDLASDGQFGAFKAIIFMLGIILFCVMGVILLTVIARRFKKSVLGDEAYLNFTLPVTIGEHLCGRYLANIVWSIAYSIVMLISVLLVLIRGWGRAGEFISNVIQKSAEFKLKNGYGFGWIFFQSYINAVISFLFICLLVYVIESIIHLIGKHKTLVAVLAFGIIFTVYHNVAHARFLESKIDVGFFMRVLWKMDIYNLIWIVALSIATRVILQFRLNLE